MFRTKFPNAQPVDSVAGVQALLPEVLLGDYDLTNVATLDFRNGWDLLNTYSCLKFRVSGVENGTSSGMGVSYYEAGILQGGASGCYTGQTVAGTSAATETQSNGSTIYQFTPATPGQQMRMDIELFLSSQNPANVYGYVGTYAVFNSGAIRQGVLWSNAVATCPTNFGMKIQWATAPAAFRSGRAQILGVPKR